MSVTFANVVIKIGNKLITPTSTEAPSHFQSLDYERFSSSAGNKATIRLFDDDATVVESYIIAGYRNIELQYGLGDVNKAYKLLINDYDLEFTNWGVTLNLYCVSTGLASNNTNITSTGTKDVVSNKVYKGSPSDVFLAVAKDSGWKTGYVEPCRLKTTKDIYGNITTRTYQRSGETAADFLIKKVIPYAESDSLGESGYGLYFNDETGEVGFFPQKSKRNYVLHKFTVGGYVGESNSPNIEGGFNVLSWSPSYKGSVFLAQNSSVTVSYVDIEGKTKNITYGEGNGNTKIVTVSGESEAAALAKFLMQIKINESMMGILRIVNYGNVEPYSRVALNVFSKNGVQHQTSGTYLVTKVKDTVSNGNLYTELTMIGFSDAERRREIEARRREEALRRNYRLEEYESRWNEGIR